MRVIDKTTGNEVKPGNTITDFRGNLAIFIAATRANEDGRDGKVRVGGEYGVEYYARVFNLEVVP